MPARAADKPPDDDNELEVLIPDQTLTLSTGEQVTVHEYSFMEGLRVDALAGGLIKSLQDLFLASREKAQDFRLHDLAAIFGAEPQIMSELMAMACDRGADWVKALSDQDGQLLILAWWNVNRSFFVRRLVTELGARMSQERGQRQAGAESSPD